MTVNLTPGFLREAIWATQKYLENKRQQNYCLDLDESPTGPALNQTLKDFEIQHGIFGKHDGQHLILDYNQFAIKWDEPYGYVCRGLVLDATDLRVLGFGLNKFFNALETHCAPIDWESAVTFEKIDGSMVNRWWSPHTEQFELSTRFQLPGDMERNEVAPGLSWAAMVRECLKSYTDNFTQDPNTTVVLEACARYNQVVVRHAKPFCRVLAIRNRESLEEISVLDHPLAPKSYRFAVASEVLDFANQHEATELEGFVVLDKNWNRTKIKSDQYVLLHRLKDGLNGIKNLILLARGRDYEEITAHFPEYKEDLDAVSAMLEEVIARHEAVYAELSGITVQKDFALAVQRKGLENSSALYLFRAGKTDSIRQGFDRIIPSVFVRMFKEAASKVLTGQYADDGDE